MVGADPEIAFFQRRHELAANEFEENEGCDQRAYTDAQVILLKRRALLSKRS